MEVNLNDLLAKEIQAQQTINACTRWQRMSQHREVVSFLSHGLDSPDRDASSELDPAAGRHLNPVGSG